MFLEIFFLAITLASFCILWRHWNSKGMPPGPLKIPFLGTLIQIRLADKEGYLAMHKLSRKYGDVMSLKMGFLDVVVLSSYEVIKEVFSREETLGRHSEGIWWDRCMKQNAGIVFSNGKTWEVIRQFCKDTLRDYGFGNRNAMEQLIQEEIVHLLEFMEEDRKANGGKIHFSTCYFQFAFVNSLASLITGSRHAYEDVDIQKLLKASKDYVESGVVGSGILTAFPFLRFVFPEVLGYNTQMRALEGINVYAKKLLEQRKKHDYAKNPQCFTDDYLNKIDQNQTVNDAKSIFTEKQFLVLFTDLLQAGSDTSSNNANFTLLQLTCNPKIQAKMYQEILETCGTERLPTMDDRTMMPYTKAVILEGMRWARTIVNGVPKRVTTDFQYRKYTIKKNTILLTNVHTIFFDEEFWGDPHIFKPERFLDDKNDLIPNKVERISVAFGSGRRSCFGEVLARDSSFLFLTALIQRFSFQLPENNEKPRLDPLVGFSLGPHPYEAIVRRR